MADPTRDYPDSEIEFSLGNWGGWFGWFGERPDEAIKALQWKASQGDELPDDLLLLRDAFAQFGYAPIEEAVARVQGLEKAIHEIEMFVDVGLSGEEALGVGSHATHQLVGIQEIVRRCIKSSGAFGDEEGADDA